MYLSGNVLKSKTKKKHSSNILPGRVGYHTTIISLSSIIVVVVIQCICDLYCPPAKIISFFQLPQ